MPKITDSNVVEDGMIMGFIQTESMTDPVSFAICTVDEWEKMSDEEADKEAIEAKNESGMIDFWY